MIRTFTASALALAAATSVATAQHDLPQAESEWFTAGKDAIQSVIDRQPNTDRPLNVILMVSGVIDVAMGGGSAPAGR